MSPADGSVKAAGIAVGLGLLVPFLALVAAADGYVLSHLWLWFVVPLGAPSISVPHACGIGLLVRCLRPVHVDQLQKADDHNPALFLLKILATPFGMLGFGWILRAAM